MKKFLALAISIIAIVVCTFAVACGKSPVKADENTVFITVTDKSYNDKTLSEYMNHLQDEGELTFKLENGMVTSLNGKANTQNSFWMLYTDDAENANEAWGTFEHEGVIYGSAVAGVGELRIKEGCSYIWTYQTF